MDTNALEMSKVTFGLDAKKVQIIESRIDRTGNNYHTWQEIGKELSWCPLTISLYYHNYKKSKQKRDLEQRIESLKGIVEHYKETNQLEDGFKCQVRLEMLNGFKDEFFD